MSLLDLCDREIAAVPLEATVADAIHKMLDHHVNAGYAACGLRAGTKGGAILDFR